MDLFKNHAARMRELEDELDILNKENEELDKEHEKINNMIEENDKALNDLLNEEE